MATHDGDNMSDKRHRLELQEIDGVSKDRLIAEAYLSPETVNASVAVEWGQRWFPDLSLNDAINILRYKAEKVREGDLSDMEGTLSAQVRSLDLIYTSLAARAANSQSVDFVEKYLRLALKAQNQARATVETLQEIKHPRQAFFIGQQNIADQQQVNNEIGIRSREREAPKNGNELLEATDGERLDTRAASTTGRADTPLATMGEINRSKDKKRNRP